MIPLKTFHNLASDKKERITQTAIEEFSEKGYAQASINSIVSRLGIAKGSIFQYFGDKKSLFLFAFNTSMEMVKDYLRTVRDQTVDEPLFTRLEATLMAGFLFLKKHPVIYKLYIKTIFEDSIPFKNEILLSLREYSLKYLRSLLETAKQKGEIVHDIDIDKASFILDAIMDRFLQACMLPHLDAGLGIYNCSHKEAQAWIKELAKILSIGISTKK